MKKSRKQGVLHLNDLYDLPPNLQSTELTDQLEANWFDEVKHNPTNPSLIRVTLRTIGWKPFLNGFLTLLNVSENVNLLNQSFYDCFLKGITQIIQPLLLTFLIKFFESCTSMPTWQAWLIATATILIALLSSLIINQVFFLILFFEIFLF